MKKITILFMAMLMLLSMVGCGAKSSKSDPILSEDLNSILEKIYESADFDKEQKDAIMNYETTKLDESNAGYILGTEEVKFKEGILSAPLMNVIPYQLVLLRLEDGADIEATKEILSKNANPRKWVCVEAEEVVVENIDNVVLFMMANEEEATPIKNAFMNLSK